MPTLDLLDVVAATLDDAALTATASSLAEVRRRIDVKQAEVAAEMHRRSAREHGMSGLAQRLGQPNVERLVQRLTGATKPEARALLRAGELMTTDADPWLGDVGAGLETGRVSVAQADVIGAGLGAPSPDIAADDLADAARKLVALAPGLTVEQLGSQARAMRDELDLAGIAARESALREKRYLSLSPTPDGMTRLSGLLDPESARIVAQAYDAVTSPRRGGVRFVDPEAQQQADAIVADPRTTGQLALDTFVDLIAVATRVEPNRLPASRRHAVQVLVTARDLASGTGAAFFRDGSEAVSIETARRHACDAGMVPIQFDDNGEALRLGRQQRLFTAKQRAAIVARDGGCRFPGCSRPASWTEVHHRIHWSKGGGTDVEEGILLCRFHHLLVHDNEWQIERDAVHGFVAIPPPSVDPRRVPLPMPSRSRVLGRLRA